MLIRAFEPADAPALSALFSLSVRKVAKGVYSPAQLEAWSARSPSPDALVQQALVATILVAVGEEDRVIGYGSLEPDGHICQLYCHPDHIRSGTGTAICSALEEIARKSGIKRLFVEASECALSLFQRREFELAGRNDFVLDSVPIHNYRMTKLLG